MLVLSRRESEEILFPTLGITVKVVHVKGNMVRLGIEAPKSIRVIRSELESVPPNRSTKRKSNYGSKSASVRSQSKASVGVDHAEIGSSDIGLSDNYDLPNGLDSERASVNSDVQKCLDAANLAVHLAQNQLRQKLNCRAEKALQNALDCLEDLEFAVADSQSWNLETAAVHEATSGYRVGSAISVPSAAVFARNENLRERLAKLLASNGFEVVKFDDEFLLLEYLRHSQQPAVVLTAESVCATDCSRISSDDAIEFDEAFENAKPLGQNRVLEICGVSGLKKNRNSFTLSTTNSSYSSNSMTSSVNPVQITGWFATAEFAADIGAIIERV